jgi:hypothetical protein
MRRQPLQAKVWGGSYRTWWDLCARHKKRAKRRSAKRERQKERMAHDRTHDAHEYRQ